MNWRVEPWMPASAVVGAAIGVLVHLMAEWRLVLPRVEDVAFAALLGVFMWWAYRRARRPGGRDGALIGIAKSQASDLWKQLVACVAVMTGAAVGLAVAVVPALLANRLGVMALEIGVVFGGWLVGGGIGFVVFDRVWDRFFSHLD